jgi:hypothetical protein
MRKPWYSPQSRQFNDLVRALKNALAMVGFMAVLMTVITFFGGHK